jgi:hypothetical protein
MNTKEGIEEINQRAKVTIYGEMGILMRANGMMDFDKVWENGIVILEKFMKASGLKVRLLDME